MNRVASSTTGPPGTDPLVGPPFYAAWYAAQRTLPAVGSNPLWLTELDLDPRHRVAAALGNTLERVATSRYREVEQMEAALQAAGALGTAMSGSGLTVFGVARSFDHARQIRARVARARWACWAVRTLRGPAIRVR